MQKTATFATFFTHIVYTTMIGIGLKEKVGVVPEVDTDYYPSGNTGGVVWVDIVTYRVRLGLSPRRSLSFAEVL
jgi:hypothetical protein